MTLRDLDNERETVCDEQALGIRHGMATGGMPQFSGKAALVAQRRAKAGLGQRPIHIGYDREAREAAAPGRDAFFADKTSQWARPVPQNERRA